MYWILGWPFGKSLKRNCDTVKHTLVKRISLSCQERGVPLNSFRLVYFQLALFCKCFGLGFFFSPCTRRNLGLRVFEYTYQTGWRRAHSLGICASEIPEVLVWFHKQELGLHQKCLCSLNQYWIWGLNIWGLWSSISQLLVCAFSSIIETESTDDDKIVSYHWEELKGPLREEKVSSDTAILTLTNLVPGNYTFR